MHFVRSYLNSQVECLSYCAFSSYRFASSKRQSFPAHPIPKLFTPDSYVEHDIAQTHPQHMLSGNAPFFVAWKEGYSSFRYGFTWIWDCGLDVCTDPERLVEKFPRLQSVSTENGSLTALKVQLTASICIYAQNVYPADSWQTWLVSRRRKGLKAFNMFAHPMQTTNAILALGSMP